VRSLIYSDVHGNLPAFEMMLGKVGRCDRHICLGDLVNYGPWSNECIDLAMSLPNSTFLMGNHEEAFLQGFYPGSNELVKTFFKVTYDGFDRFDAINGFQEYSSLDSYRLMHTIQDMYIYPDTDIILDDNYVIGHSHHQFTYQNNGFVLFNAGSVGQNRKYINICNYLIHTPEHGITMEQLAYPVEILIDEMRSRGYPQQCIDYYRNKEIL
jgi:predicted phosphodiesterase